MMRIILEPVDNGIIKIVEDDNIDGAGKFLEKKEIFMLQHHDINDVNIFLESLIKDLGLYLGNPADKEVLKLEKTYGNHYNLSLPELNDKRIKLTNELNHCKRLVSDKKNSVNENSDN